MTIQGIDVIKFLDQEYSTHLYNINPSNIYVTSKG